MEVIWLIISIAFVFYYKGLGDNMVYNGEDSV